MNTHQVQILKHHLEPFRYVLDCIKHTPKWSAEMTEDGTYGNYGKQKGSFYNLLWPKLTRELAEGWWDTLRVTK